MAESRHTLEDGTELQLLHQPAHQVTRGFAPQGSAHSAATLRTLKGTDSRLTQDKRSPSKPPLLFVHGAYHAAWCVFCCAVARRISSVLSAATFFTSNTVPR